MLYVGRNAETSGSVPREASDATWSKVHERAPQHDRVAHRRRCPRRPGPPGELGVLPGREELVALAGELRELLDDHGAGRHVDPERERLGGEDDLHQPGGERLLDRLLHRRHHARVVRGEAGLERVEPRRHAEHGELVVGERRRCARRRCGGSRPAPRGVVSAHPRRRVLLDRLVAAGPAEHEDDRRQHRLAVEELDDLDRGSGCGAGRASCPAAPPGRRVRSSALGLGVAAGARSAGRRRPTKVGSRCEVVAAPLPRQVPVARASTGRRSSITASVGPRTVRSSRRPRSAFETVADRHTSGIVVVEVDDHLLPHRAAVPVLEVVHLVEHDDAEPVERGRRRVDHVAQHLGGHHHHRRLAVDRVVAGEQADADRGRSAARSRRTSGSRAPSAASCRRPSRRARASPRSRTRRRASCPSRSAPRRAPTGPRRWRRARRLERVEGEAPGGGEVGAAAHPPAGRRPVVSAAGAVVAVASRRRRRWCRTSGTGRRSA